jgi:opacity protein-like surface antigen
MPRYRRVWVTLISAAALFGSSAGAADAPRAEPQQFEISPFAGYRLGGSFRMADTGQRISLTDHDSFALALDLRGDELTQYELFYSRQSTKLRGTGLPAVGTVVEYLQIGGTVALDDMDRVKPYFGAGIGVARLSPDLVVGREDTRFALSLALGLRAPLSQHFALRLEARGFWTPVNTDTAVFCRADQGDALCRVRVRGSGFVQGDFLAGLAYSF